MKSIVETKTGTLSSEIGKDGMLHTRLSANITDVDELKKFTTESEGVVKRQYDRTGKPLLSLVDVTELKGYVGGAVNEFVNYLRAVGPYISRTAVFGASDGIVMAEEMLLALSGRKNMRMFKTKGEAEAWLMKK